MPTAAAAAAAGSRLVQEHATARSQVRTRQWGYSTLCRVSQPWLGLTHPGLLRHSGLADPEVLVGSLTGLASRAAVACKAAARMGVQQQVNSMSMTQHEWKGLGQCPSWTGKNPGVAANCCVTHPSKVHQCTCRPGQPGRFGPHHHTGSSRLSFCRQEHLGTQQQQHGQLAAGQPVAECQQQLHCNVRKGWFDTRACALRAACNCRS